MARSTRGRMPGHQVRDSSCWRRPRREHQPRLRFSGAAHAAGIESANVVRVIEVGEKPVPYLVMEKLDGKTLAEMLRNKSSLPATTCSSWCARSAGIHGAAAAGIVHRDLKPRTCSSTAASGRCRLRVERAITPVER